MPLDQRFVLGETPVTRWLSALYRGQGVGQGAGVVPRTDVPTTRSLTRSTLFTNPETMRTERAASRSQSIYRRPAFPANDDRY